MFAHADAYHKIRVALLSTILVGMILPKLHTCGAPLGLVTNRSDIPKETTDMLVDNLIDRAFAVWSDRGRDLDNTTSQKRKRPDLSFGNQDVAYWHVSDRGKSVACNKTKIQISAEWRLLTCSNSVKGDLAFEVMTGIGHESEYTQELARAVGAEIEGGMEFAIGPLVKDAGGSEKKHLFKSAWSTSIEHETIDTVSCEIFGGTWCMWQWHMKFSQCHERIEWDSPLTQCSRGMNPPSVPENTVEVERIEPSVPVSTFLLTSNRLINSCLCFIIVLSMVVGSYFVLCLRRLGTSQNLRERWRGAS